MRNYETHFTYDTHYGFINESQNYGRGGRP